MAVRSTMAALLSRVRTLCNDPAGTNESFDDQTYQDALDRTRQDLRNVPLKAYPTFSGATIQYLDYYSNLSDWEDDLVLKQYLITLVTPSTSENLVGHWQFSATTLPPVYITGKTYDVYRAAADMLERLSTKWMLSYNMTVNGQSLQRSGAFTMIRDLILDYRRQQRPGVIHVTRSDVGNKSSHPNAGLGPLEIDYMADGRGS